MNVGWRTKTRIGGAPHGNDGIYLYGPWARPSRPVCLRDWLFDCSAYSHFIAALTAVTSARRRSAITQGNHDDAAPLHVVQEVAHDAPGSTTIESADALGIREI